MRILHCIATYAPAWNWGGPVVSTAALCEGLAELGHEVTVFTTTAGLDGSFDGLVAERGGVTVHYFRRQPGIGIKSQELETAMAEKVSNFDIVHVTGVWQRTARAACRAATQAGVPYIMSPRGALGSYAWRQKTIKKAAYYLLYERRNIAGTAGFHLTCSMEAKECAYFLRDRVSRVIPNGVLQPDWVRDDAGAKQWRKENRFAEGTPIFLYIGRLHRTKGLDLLPSALERLGSRPWNMAFLGVDEDGTGAALAKAFAALRMTDRIRFLPTCSKPELRAAYSAASVFLLPSRYDSFGNVVIEALGCGCPALVSDGVGVGADAEGSGAVTVLPRDPAVWAQQLKNYLDGTWTPIAPGPTATWVHARFSKKPVAQRMAEFYSELVHAHPSLGVDRKIHWEKP